MLTHTHRIVAGLLSSFLVVAAVRGPASVPQETPSARAGAALARPSVAPVTVLCVRHAEKQDDGTRDPGLTEAGAARAAALARLLGHAEVTHVFSTDYERTRATVQPLAEARGLELTTYSPADAAVFARELRALPPGSIALVAGHSNTTPGVVEALGGDVRDVPRERGALTLPHEAYDRLYVVTLPSAVDGEVTTLELRYGEPSAE